MTPQVIITSFGYGHGPAPQADITIDARRYLRNPHHDPAMVNLTGLDQAVLSHVNATPGAAGIAVQVAALVRNMLSDRENTLGLVVTVAIGCTGGRHRSVALAELISGRLWAANIIVDTIHRDIERPILPTSVHTDQEGGQ